MHKSPFNKRNSNLGNWSDWAADKDNLTFVSEALTTMKQSGVGNDGEFVIVLIGSRDLPGVSLRQAQSVIRWDRRPSYWSHAFVIGKPWNGKSNVGALPIYGVPLYSRSGMFPDPKNNGVVSSTLAQFADKERDANIALFSVAQTSKKGAIPLSKEHMKALRKRLAEPNADRMRYDLWETLCAWNRYLWSWGAAENPLQNNIPIPASSFIEMLFEAIDLDLVPGASERNSALEHLWVTTHWWLQNDGMKEDSGQNFTTCGCFAIRDQGCSTMG